MVSQNRMMTLVAFLQAQNCSNLPGSCRHPSTMLDFLTPEYYQRIARTLEDGKIQMAFFDDRLALPDLYTGHHAEAIAAGVRAVKMDPSTILMTMGMVTQRLGLGVTYYIMPVDLFVSGSVGIGWLAFEDDAGQSKDTSAGIALDALIGKEWWVGSDWGIGVAAQLLYMHVKDYTDDAGMDAFAVNVLFTATYN